MRTKGSGDDTVFEENIVAPPLFLCNSSSSTDPIRYRCSWWNGNFLLIGGFAFGNIQCNYRLEMESNVA